MINERVLNEAENKIGFKYFLFNPFVVLRAYVYGHTDSNATSP